MSRLKIVILFLLLTSCSIDKTQEFDTMFSNDEIIDTLKIQKTNKKISNTWYYIFDDPDLNTLLSKAMVSNFSINQAIERLKQSRYSYMIETTGFLPNIDIIGDYNFSKTDNKSFTFDEENFFKSNFDVSWEIDIWGKSNQIKGQYLELINKAKFDLADLKVSIIAEIIINYISLKETENLLIIANKNINIQKDILNMVKEKYNAGIEDTLALRQAEYSLEQTKSTIPLLKQKLESYKNSIAILLGVLPKNLENFLKNKKNITSNTFKYSVKSFYKLPLNIIETRPDVKNAETNVREQNYIINQAFIDMLPTVNLEASFGFISKSGNKLFNDNNKIYGYTPTIAIPVWNWGQLKNNVELQKLIHKEYVLAYNEAIISAVMDLKNSLYNIEQTYKTNSYAKNSTNKMRDIFELTKNKYINGIIDFTDLANAEQNLLEAENAYIQSNANILKSITYFYKATGGGYNFMTD
ncbi:MAG: TolC family protein [Alphaproteobacteria bacterium]|nr:TolC family protein [Alphaproteobacteria bacterium]